MRSTKFKAGRPVRCECGDLVRPGRMHYPGNDPENGAAHKPYKMKVRLGFLFAGHKKIGQLNREELVALWEEMYDWFHTPVEQREDELENHKMEYMLRHMMAVKSHLYVNCPF